jgi:hypothetical protein
MQQLPECSGILSNDGQVREDLAKLLIAAILKHTGRREQSAMERIGCQLVCFSLDWTRPHLS